LGLGPYSEDVDARISRALIYLDVFEFTQAAFHDLNYVIQIDPENSLAYSIRARAYTNLQEFDKAVVDLGKAISFTEDDYKFIHERGCFYAQRGDYQKAISDFTESLKRTQNPKIQASILIDRGRSYSNLDPNNSTAEVHYKALEDFRQALRINESPENLDSADFKIPALLLAMSELSTGNSESSRRSITSWFKGRFGRLIGK